MKLKHESHEKESMKLCVADFVIFELIILFYYMCVCACVLWWYVYLFRVTSTFTYVSEKNLNCYIYCLLKLGFYKIILIDRKKNLFPVTCRVVIAYSNSSPRNKCHRI